MTKRRGTVLARASANGDKWVETSAPRREATPGTLGPLDRWACDEVLRRRGRHLEVSPERATTVFVGARHWSEVISRTWEASEALSLSGDKSQARGCAPLPDHRLQRLSSASPTCVGACRHGRPCAGPTQRLRLSVVQV